MYGMMDHMLARERKIEADIESGALIGQGDRPSCSVSASNENRNFSCRVRNGILSFSQLANLSRFGEVNDRNIEFLLDKNSEGEDSQNYMTGMCSKHIEDKQKRKSSEKPPKPPRPPKGPSLDAADQKLVREIAELAMRRRARMERIKVLKKMKAAKSSSWNSSLSAMIITVLFFVIILFQGICSRNGGSIFLRGSPEAGVAATEDFISVKLFPNLSAYEDRSPGSGNPNSANEQVSVSGQSKE